ncbi:hypothetical protein [Emticicia sp. 17c]|uniref:hypothetical protein n=1 Tax=Emticicia sp. 17c TaxID=3127704 RepID=UPI00301C505D
MKTYIITLISILVFCLWLLPFMAIVVCKGANEWCVLYLPIALITAYWVYAITETFKTQ